MSGHHKGKVPLELVHQQRGALRSPPLVPNGVFHLDLIKNHPVVQLNQECIPDRTLLGIVVVDAEPLLLNAVNLGTESIDASVCRRCVGASDG